ncbi:MAG: tautomerase family protein [Burkholderiaceae bacterium]|nr:tautomerase family protein [Burkholderiaceae bacterium]
MPILNVQISQGSSALQKTALLQKMTQAVVDSVGAPLASIRIVLQEVPPEHVIVAGEVGKEMALVTANLIEGRTDALKAALIAALANAIEQATGISTQNVRVVLYDIPKTDLGVAGGRTALAAGR